MSAIFYFAGAIAAMSIARAIREALPAIIELLSTPADLAVTTKELNNDA